MAELDLLTEIHTDVKYIKETLADHIEDDKQNRDEAKRVNEKFLLPLWEAHQQQKGAAKMAAISYSLIGGITAWAFSYFTGINHK